MAAPSHRFLALLAVATLALGACGDGDEDRDDERDDAAATTTTAGSGTGTTDEEGTSTTAAPTATTSGEGSATTVVSTMPGAPAEPAADGVIELSIAGGNLEGGVRREKVEQGSQVTIRVTSDVADELHVHTYDLSVDLVPGRSADLTFLARIPGVHEVELEQRHKKVLELEVSA